MENSIYAYDFDNQHADQFVAIRGARFLQTYGEVTLPNGAPAKLAMYFPKTQDLRELRPVVERTLLADGLSHRYRAAQHVQLDGGGDRGLQPAQRSRGAPPGDPAGQQGDRGLELPQPLRLRAGPQDPEQPELRAAGQHPLPAPGAGQPRRARIYLSSDNRSTLDRQLQETYGETIGDLDRTASGDGTARIDGAQARYPAAGDQEVDPPRGAGAELRGLGDPEFSDLHLEKPDVARRRCWCARRLHASERPDRASVLDQQGEATESGIVGPDTLHRRRAAGRHLPAGYAGAPRRAEALYGDGGGIVPETHLPALRAQIEEQTCRYRIEEEEVEEALALLKVDEGGFQTEDADGDVVYTAEITYPTGKEHLLLSWQQLAEENAHDFGFHYSPYNFDSQPEEDYFLRLLRAVNTAPEEVEDIYFTGALTDPRTTDFFVEYRGVDGKWHRYSPDFVVRRTDGRCLIVEVKAERERAHPIDGAEGRKAVATRRWVDLNPDRLQYEMVFTNSDVVAFNQVQSAKDFVKS